MCWRKKKNLKKNSAQKTFAPNKKKTKSLKRLQSDQKKKEADDDGNISSIQAYDVDYYNHDSRQFPDSDDKEAFYPPVTEPTPSTKRKREEDLEKDKEQKIKEGFYQSRSDEDDTLEPVKSLKDEETDPEDKSNKSKKIKQIKSASQRAAQSKKLKTHAQKKIFTDICDGDETTDRCCEFGAFKSTHVECLLLMLYKIQAATDGDRKIERNLRSRNKMQI
ncbi:unnamed protein product [Cercopithifilaria johnstoni]|uniref:Uncharacterized protein n=1 Tax=Cercopithifilaria johnstoni TaxID=2874296 RepID=A0A8J2M2X3_9BILA|nr:unnamed protein product [Cercopithifilaria johnstoni]